MSTPLFHITINGKPACLRGADGIPLIEESSKRHIWLGCSRSDRAVMEDAAALFRKHHPDWIVEIVPGGCPVLADEVWPQC